MKEEDLNRVVKILEQNGSEEDAYFEFFYDDFPDYETIRANKDGLIVYATALLKAIKKFELRHNQLEEGHVDNYIKFEVGDWYANVDSSLPYIKPIFEKRNEIVKSELVKEKLISKIMPYILVLILLVIVASFIIGLIEILNWIFR